MKTTFKSNNIFSAIFTVFFLLVLVSNAFANSINPYRIIIKLKNMPQVSSSQAIQPYLNNLSNTIGLDIAKVQPMADGAYVLIFAPNKIQQLASKTNSTVNATFKHIIELLAKRNDMLFAIQDEIIKVDPQPNTAKTIKVSHADQWDEQVPEDSIPSNPSWGVNLEKAWDITRGSSDIVVAVIDTGIATNTDLNDNILAGYNFVDDNDDPTDGGPGYHGTHVSGTIAANGTIFGMAPRTKIVPIKVLNDAGLGSISNVVNGIYWAVNDAVPGTPANPNPAKVLNLSLNAIGDCLQIYQDAVNAARAKDATVVIAAGNNNGEAASSRPGNCSGVIDVAATNWKGIRASYSNYGTTVTLGAPGGMTYSAILPSGILSTTKNGYQYKQGTSMAAPHVAGIAALLYSIKSTFTPDEIETILINSVHTFNTSSGVASPYDCVTAPKTCGAGLVDAYAAVVEAQSMVKASYYKTTIDK
jgi:serine protease